MMNKRLNQADWHIRRAEYWIGLIEEEGLTKSRQHMVEHHLSDCRFHIRKYKEEKQEALEAFFIIYRSSSSERKE
jgi:hypothetical protein